MNNDKRNKKLLVIGTDRKIFEHDSDVRKRQIKYAEEWGEVHIIVFCKRGQCPREASLSSKCFVYSTQSWNRWLYFLDAIRLGRFIVSKRKVDEISCQDPFLTAMSAISLKKEFDLPLQIQVHTDISAPKYGYKFSNKIRKIMAVSQLKQADQIRVVSDKMRDYAFSIAPSVPVIVKPIFVDEKSIQSAPIVADLHAKYPQFKKIILMASRLEPEKNISLAVDVMPHILKEMPDIGLVIVGEGSQSKELADRTRKIGISKYVVFEPWVNKDVLYSYYKTADVFLNTSFFEGYGMTIVEASAAGIKVISTDVGVARERGADIISFDPIETASVILKAIS